MHNWREALNFVCFLKKTRAGLRPMKKILSTSILLVVLALMFAPASQAAHGKCPFTQCSTHACGPDCLYYKKVWINPCRPGVMMNYYGSSRPSYVSAWNNPHEYYRGANMYYRCPGWWKPRPYTVYYRSNCGGMHRKYCPKAKCSKKCPKEKESESQEDDYSNQ